MPYIGNPAVVGDSTNTFKLLDDIASFTLTFDGSSTDVVSVANNTLTFANHRFVTGQRVTYTDGGGTVITGLTDGTAYFIIKVDQSTIKLATNASNAASSTAIDLTGVGAGTSHTLNVAFDGVNTKFKATHSNGTKAGVSRAAQLSLSINGVIQQPTEAKPPTVGYGIESDSTIVFSTAPSVADKVFGSFIGEVAPSFDITDNTVNNFTGDGSTSTFNLSKEIPSNNDVLVTLDGVTQYPSDTSTTRAYSVVGSSLVFVSAPADGVAIQVRMIGFAGSTAAEVTGFYGRTGNVALKSTDDITFQNASAGIITASKFVGELVGVVTATDFFVSGIATFASDVGIAGTLTYEDVTNIDSVGIITARSNILVGSGITLSPDGDIFATGISTFSEGFAGDVLIDDKIVHRGDTDTAIRFPAADTITAETGGSERLRINSSGSLLVNHTTGRGVGNTNVRLLQVEGVGGESAITVVRNSNNTSGAGLMLGKSRSVSVGGTTIVQDDDKLGVISFCGADGVDLLSISAQIIAEVDGTPGADDTPGRLVFRTTADGENATAERMRITKNGAVGINVQSPVAKLDIASSSGIGLSITNPSNFGTAELHLNGARNEGTGIVGEFTVHNQKTGQLNKIRTDGAGKFTFLHDSSELMSIDETGDIDVKGGQISISKQGEGNNIKVGTGQNASNYAYIDFIGDTHWTTYGLRLLRGNGGQNTFSHLNHRGTGNLEITTIDSAPIIVKTGNVERLRMTSGGVILKGHDTASSDIHDPQTTTDRTPNIQIHGGSSVQASAALISWSSNTGSYYSNALFLAHSGSDTIGTNGAVSSSNTLGSIVFSGDDGDEFIKGAMIAAHVDGTPANNDMPARLMFYTNAGGATAAERVRIDASGNFHVDCTSEPTQGDAGARITNGSYHTFARSTNNSAVLRSFGNNGEFRTIGSGNAQNTNNSYGAISDIELKENIVDANSQLNDIKSIKIRNYNFKESTGYNTHKQIGVVAQELESLGMNGLVETNPDELYIAGDEIPDGKNIGDVKEKGYKTVKYSVLYMKAIKALQESIVKIEALEARVSALEG